MVTQKAKIFLTVMLNFNVYNTIHEKIASYHYLYLLMERSIW